MTLSFSGDTPDDLILALIDLDNEARKRVREVIITGAKEIMQASIDMTPVDEGNLEAAHSLGTSIDDGVLFSVEISVGGEHGGRDVDDYAAFIHEGLLPFGSGFAGSIGQKSQEKSANNPSDRPVGGKFLERAVELFEESLLADIQSAMPGD